MAKKASVTISITIPTQLEESLQGAADNLGVSRSRFIGNLLLEWQQKYKPGKIKKLVEAPKKIKKPIKRKKRLRYYNMCNHNIGGKCTEYGGECKMTQVEASKCEGYVGK